MISTMKRVPYKKDAVSDTLIDFLQGVRLTACLKKTSEQSNTTSYFQKIEKKIDSLKEENRNLRKIVQMYLSRIESLENHIKELMSPKRKTS